MTKKIHYFSGITITLFVSFHLLNHMLILFGPEIHLAFMNTIRIVYRNIIAEYILILAVIVQVVSGIKLFRNKIKELESVYDKLHVLSGVYLAFFFLIHVSAILTGRLYFDLDTNLYFGAAGYNSSPHMLFFVPYYALAIISFFTHIACIHRIKMSQYSTNKKTINYQANAFILLGLLFSLIITIGMMGLEIPKEYFQILGK